MPGLYGAELGALLVGAVRPFGPPRFGTVGGMALCGCEYVRELFRCAYDNRSLKELELGERRVVMGL